MALGPKHVSLAKLEMRVAAAGLAIVVMAGCSMMNPYNHESLEEVPPPAGLRLAGDASEGVKAAEDLRQKYYKNLSSTSYVRSSTGLAAGVLSGWAIYNALKPGASASSASPGDTRRGVRLGVTLGVLYGLRQFFVNPEQESIYAEGYRALTCLMLESSPLLMTESTEKISMPPNGGTAAADILLPPYTEKPLGDLDRLELALDRLERRILDLNVQLATDETIANAIAGEDKGIRSAQWALRDQFERTKKVLAYSRNALADGRTLVRTIKGAGRDIRDRAGIIAGTVNTQVQGKQHDLAKAADLLKDAHDITSSILNIGGTTAADQTEVTSSDPPISMAYPPQGRMIQVARLMSAPDLQNVQMGSTLLAAAPAGTPAPSSPSAAASASSQASVPPKKKPKATTAASKNEPPTSAELQAIRDKLDIAIKGIAEREAEAQKKAEAEAHEKELAARDKTIRELTARLNAKELSCGRASAAGCATALAEETERLYAARRPVLQELLNFRRKARAVAATPECAELAVLRVTPNEVVRAKPGDTVSYIVSQRAAGSPLAVLQGPTDAETGAKFDFSPMQGTTLFVAKIQIGPKMPDQVIRLVVADSKGVVSQTIPIVAGGSTPKAPDPPASAPKPAASSASTARSASAAARFYQPLSSLHRAVLVASHSLG